MRYGRNNIGFAKTRDMNSATAESCSLVSQTVFHEWTGVCLTVDYNTERLTSLIQCNPELISLGFVKQSICRVASSTQLTNGDTYRPMWRSLSTTCRTVMLVRRESEGEYYFKFGFPLMIVIKNDEIKTHAHVGESKLWQKFIFLFSPTTEQHSNIPLATLHHAAFKK